MPPLTVYYFLSGVDRIAPADNWYLSRLDPNLIKHPFDAATGQVTDAIDRLDLFAIGDQIIGHSANDLSLVQLGLRNFCRYPKRLKH
jgi:hypothetical protein